MPRFSPDGLRIAEYRRTWIDNHRTAYQECTDKCRVKLSDGTPIFDRAANVVTAGGGVVAAWEQHPEGVFDSLGRTYPRGVCGDAGPDGAYVLKLDHWSHGPYDVIERDGARWRLSNEDVYSVQLLGDGKAICVGMDRQIRHNLDANYLPVSSVGGRLVWGARYANGIFLCQDIETGCLTLDGRVIAPPADTYFYYDLYWDGAQYKVIWSENQADEGVVQIALYPHELEEKPLVGELESVEVPVIGRELWVGWYEFIPADLPGNCDLLVRRDTPYLVLRAHDGREIASYTAGNPDGDPDAIERAVAEAKAARPDLPCIAYVPFKMVEGRYVRWPRNADIIGVEAYRKVSESLGVFEARVRTACEAHPRVALIPQCYTSNTDNHSDLRAIVPVAARLARDVPSVQYVIPFSGSGRATGYQDHPEVHGLWTSLAASVRTPTSGQPQIPPIQPPEEETVNQPEVTVKKWDLSELKDGREFVFEDTKNPALGYRVRVFIRDGSMYAEMTNSKGTASTGMRRPVNPAQPGPTPGPSPTPPPTPQPVPPSGLVPLPESDHAFHAEGATIDAAYGRKVTPADVAHTTYRRLNENWSVENIIRDIKGQPTQGLAHKSRVPVTYAQWMNDEWPALLAALKAAKRPTGAGDVRHLGWRRFVEGWTLANLVRDIKGEAPLPTEPVPSPPPPPSSAERRAGTVRLDNRVFADDKGSFLALGFTFFALAWLYKHDRARLERNLRHLAERGVHYVRALGVVGPEGWTDRTIDPRWHDYEEVIAGATDLAWACGLRVQWTLFGGDSLIDRSGRERVVQQFIAMARTRPEKIQMLECANEAWQNGFEGEEGGAELKRYAAQLRAALPHAVATTAPEIGMTEEEADRFPAIYYKGSQANIMTIHFDRDIRGTGGMWRPVRQAWEGQFMHYNPGPWTNNEPIGPKSSVNEDDDPLRTTMAAVMTWVCGGAGYVLHTGPGVRAGGVEDLARGRESNVWEIANLDPILSGIAACRALLPTDLPNWLRTSASRHAHYRDAHPFEADPMLKAQDETFTLVRAFGSWRGASFVVAPIGMKGAVPFVARYRMKLKAHDPLTGSVLVDRELQPGEVLELGNAAAALIIGSGI